MTISEEENKQLEARLKAIEQSIQRTDKELKSLRGMVFLSMKRKKDNA